MTVIEEPQVLTVIDPSDGSIAGRSPITGLDALDAIVTSARRASGGWRSTPIDERRRAVLAVADRLEQHAEELAALITAEQGKPLGALGSRFEVGGAVAWTRHTASLDLPERTLDGPGGGGATMRRTPLGVVGVIAPWNWPLMIAMWSIAPALLAGNAVIVKPSPLTPLATLRAVELAAGVLPTGVLQAVVGDGHLGAAMAGHPGLDKIAFTGSSDTGRRVMAAAATTMKRCTLECGGNDAGIVLADADVEAIAPALFWGAFINNGQTCAALKRLYVQERRYDEVVEALGHLAGRVVVGDGRRADTQLGPVQNRMQLERVADLVERARAGGARIVAGGHRLGDAGCFYAPTIVAEIDHHTPLVGQEQFGPALPIIRFDRVEDALAMANDSIYGLGASVWSADVDAATELAARMEAGTSWVNGHGDIAPHRPFGGVKQSGLGVEFGQEGLHEFTNIQVLHVVPAGGAR